MLFSCMQSLNFWNNCRQVLRGGQWGERDAVILVPGDIISIKLGDIIPADARLLEGDPLKIDQVCNSLGSLKALYCSLPTDLIFPWSSSGVCVCLSS
jgi:hypothetical protein